MGVDPAGISDRVKNIFDSMYADLFPISIEKQLVCNRITCFSDFYPLHQIVPCLRARYVYQPLLAAFSVNQDMEVTRELPIRDYRIDFRVKTPQQLLLLELKLYNGRTIKPSRIHDACRKLSDLKAEGTIILTVANEVPDEMKAQCLDAYGIYIWDVGNLLWLFEDYPEIKTEFISFLDFSINSIEAKVPAVSIAWDNSAKPEVEPAAEYDTNWEQKLPEIKPGTEHFRAYEDACVEILKYILRKNIFMKKPCVK